MSSTESAAANEWPVLESFKAVFNKIRELPYCSGTIPLDASTSTLFYRGHDIDKAGVIDFDGVTEAQLSALAEACQPASFGRQHEDVIDESYRKAGKLDVNNFATHFSPITSGIINTIRESLLEGKNTEKDVKVELYKLNVYGPGSFFKAHVDTPRSDNMFGSLVVIFPTPHEGGSLIFRHKGDECTFDTASAVSSHKTLRAAFVAFFSDVEHEVSVVTSGYRVTVTYNLYFVNHPSVPAGTAIKPDKDLLVDLKLSLSTILSDPEFLPKGGLLAFRLSHKYPFKPGATKLSDLEKCLKGSDATIKSICEEISLSVSLKALYVYSEMYSSRKVHVLVDEFANLNQRNYESEMLEEYFARKYDAKFLYTFRKNDPYAKELEESSRVPVVWIKVDKATNNFELTYMAYGNQAEMDHMYGEVCLVAEVKPFNQRNIA